MSKKSPRLDDVPALEANSAVWRWRNNDVKADWNDLDKPRWASTTLSFLFHARDKRLRTVSPLYVPLIHVYLAGACDTFVLPLLPPTIGWNSCVFTCWLIIAETRIVAWRSKSFSTLTILGFLRKRMLYYTKIYCSVYEEPFIFKNYRPYPWLTFFFFQCFSNIVVIGWFVKQ